jgi:predicted ATP-grasp superfamily ATP-dependent carboligase
LYDEDCPGGLLAWHMHACTGTLTQTPLRTQNPRAHAVAYAQRAGQVPGDFIWPHWCSDLEPPGSMLAAQTPVCMVHAAAATPAATRALLLERRQSILQALAVD